MLFKQNKKKEKKQAEKSTPAEVVAERPIKSLAELRLEKEDLNTKYQACLREKERLEVLIDENKQDMKKINSHKRKSYFFAAITFLVSAAILVFASLILKGFLPYLAILAIPFAIIGYSYSKKTRIITILLACTGVIVYYSLCYSKDLENVSLISELLNKMNLDTKLAGTYFEPLSKIILLTLPFSFILATMRFSLGMGNLYIGQKMKIKFILKRFLWLFISLIIAFISVSVAVLVTSTLLDSKNISIFGIDNIKLTVISTFTLALLVNYFFSGNTMSLKKRSQTKLERVM